MKIVLCHGCFDWLHLGHMLHLREAAQMGDRLTVSITADTFVRKGAGRPIFNEQERERALYALRGVDIVVISRAHNAAEIIKMVRPDIFVKGCDYDEANSSPEEVEACREVGAQLRFTTSRKYSTTGLLLAHQNAVYAAMLLKQE
jgi:rfaE bifunctional protein nucleotidyltransferase chain/domain